MRKLLVTCNCGERIQVPRSALGRTGLCPSCGREISIANDNAEPLTRNRGEARNEPRPGPDTNPGNGPFRERPSEDAKRRFGMAVDLYYMHRYAEALAAFKALDAEYPNNAEIRYGVERCLEALKSGKRTLEIENKPTRALSYAPAPHKADPVDPLLNRQVVRSVILDKMLNGATDQIQLQAAELAGRVVGLFGDEEMSAQEMFELARVLAREPVAVNAT